MVLAKDDLTLTLNELKNQRTQCMIQLKVLKFSIEGLEKDLKGFPTEKRESEVQVD